MGNAEMPLSHSRIFGKAAGGSDASTNSVMPSMVHDRRVNVGGLDELRERAFSASPVPQVVATSDDVVALANHQAETTFGITAKDSSTPAT